MAGIYGIVTHTDTELSQLKAGEPAVLKKIIVASGEGVCSRGAILELNGTTFKYEKLTVDPGTTARCILAENIDATSADVTCYAFFAGYYRYDDIVFAVSTAALKCAALLAMQDRGVYVDVDFSEVAATT